MITYTVTITVTLTDNQRLSIKSVARKEVDMKRVVCLLLMFSLSLTGCGGGKKASDKATSVAKQAIEVIDDYLDGKIDASSAGDDLDELQEQMDYVDDLPQDNKNKAEDFSVQTNILIASTSILSDGYNSTPETYDKVQEARNNLAKVAGVKVR